MNDFLLNVGLAHWKPLAAVLVLPPVPMLVMVLLGTRFLYSRQWLGLLLVLGGLLGLWVTSTTALSRMLVLDVLKAPPALSDAALKDLTRQPRTAIVVLGGGRHRLAPEYGSASLNARSVERLRFGIWLSRETGLPLAFSGGIGRSEVQGPSEAELAGRIAEREFRHPVRWLETQSRDTHENAHRSVALLRANGIERIVVVTHAYHLPRALRNFERAAERVDGGKRIDIIGAAVTPPIPGPMRPGDWLPSVRGLEENYLALHELWGLLVGA